MNESFYEFSLLAPLHPCPPAGAIIVVTVTLFDIAADCHLTDMAGWDWKFMGTREVGGLDGTIKNFFWTGKSDGRDNTLLASTDIECYIEIIAAYDYDQWLMRNEES